MSNQNLNVKALTEARKAYSNEIHRRRARAIVFEGWKTYRFDEWNWCVENTKNGNILYYPSLFDALRHLLRELTEEDMRKDIRSVLDAASLEMEYPSKGCYSALARAVKAWEDTKKCN